MKPARARALVVLLAAGAALGTLWRRAADGVAPEACAHPLRRGDVFVCGERAEPGAADVGGRAWLFSQKLDLNTCSAADLERIRGVGPALARRIVEERARRGRFSRVDELDDVDGVGPKLLEQLADSVEVR